jgi:hypothetical protein
MHPEESYTDERVLVLFGICVSIVVMIQTEIDIEKAKPSTIPFPIAVGGTGASAP